MAPEAPPGPPRGLLRCPLCQFDLEPESRIWRCAAGHAYDVARQGYVNLTAGRAVHTGDTAAMLDARDAVLRAGHLDVVTDGILQLLADGLPAGALVEVGAGTAHHLGRVRRALGERHGIALDAAVPAAKRAARADPGWTTAVVADVWQPWPLRDGSTAAVLIVFAPRHHAEAARVLTPGGSMVVATPAPAHLRELREPLGLLAIEPGKDERLRAAAAPHLDLADVREVTDRRTLGHAEVAAIATMGPSGFHLDADDLRQRVAALPPRVDVTVAVTLTRFVRELLANER